MDELIKTFHIDWKLLIAQMINFAIVISVLGFFAVKPLIKLMKEREEKIETGVKNAEEVEVNLAESVKLKEKEVREGRKQAQEIITNAEKTGEDVRKEKITKANQEVEKVVLAAKEKIKNEKKELLNSTQAELGDMLVVALEKVTAGVTNDSDHKKLIDEAINELKSVKL